MIPIWPFCWEAFLTALGNQVENQLRVLVCLDLGTCTQQKLLLQLTAIQEAEIHFGRL